MNTLISYIKDAFAFLKNIVTRVINGILNFAKHVVAWFKNLNLNPQKDIPFVLRNKEVFKEQLANAPVKNVGIFAGVYNQDTDTISHIEYKEADQLDSQTRQVLGDEELVVLN